MSTVAERRSVAYSADTSSSSGRVACQVVRTSVDGAAHVCYSILVHNDTDGDLLAVAVAPNASESRYRIVLQSVIFAKADFSTSVELEVVPYGEMPELQLEVSSLDIAFRLSVPGTDVSARVAGDPRRIALPNRARLHKDTSAIATWRTEPILASPSLRTNGSSRTLTQGPGRAMSAQRSSAARPERSPAIVPVLLLFIAIVAATALFVFRPNVEQLDVPAEARADVPIVIGYRATGLGVIGYQVFTPEGKPILSGPLSAGSGQFSVMLPHDALNRTYLVTISVDTRFGNAREERYVQVRAVQAPVRARLRAAAPVRPVAPPQIRSLALDQGTVMSGATLNIFYDVDATSGDIALVDAASQIAYGRSVLSHDGRTAFVVPVTEAPRSMSVVLTARRGTEIAQSRVALTVEPRNAASASDGSQPTDATAAQAVNSTPVIVAPNTVRARQLIGVTVNHAVAGLVLTLSDNQGNELARRDVGPASETTAFAAPFVRAPTSLRLEAVYPQGAGTETIVHTIVVTPH